MLQHPPLDAYVLLPQIFRITTLARSTGPDGHEHDFSRHAHAEFPSRDAHGTPIIENIMSVVDTMAEVLAALCQPNILVSSESNCNPVRRLLGELRDLCLD
jgi:hypothetical protein